MRRLTLLLFVAACVGCGPALSEQELGEVIYELPRVDEPASPTVSPPATADTVPPDQVGPEKPNSGGIQ